MGAAGCGNGTSSFNAKVAKGANEEGEDEHRGRRGKREVDREEFFGEEGIGGVCGELTYS